MVLWQLTVLISRNALWGNYSERKALIFVVDSASLGKRLLVGREYAEPGGCVSKNVDWRSCRAERRDGLDEHDSKYAKCVRYREQRVWETIVHFWPYQGVGNGFEYG